MKQPLNTASLVTYNGGHVPIVFICEDNGLGISVPTPTNWIENRFSNQVGMKYIQTNGLDLIDLYQKTIQAERYSRKNRHPVFLHMKTVRLMGHAGSDIEMAYMSQQELNDIDSTGHFEADDEVGSIFNSIKEVVNELNVITFTLLLLNFKSL